jgi:hypothetical protein
MTDSCRPHARIFSDNKSTAKSEMSQSKTETCSIKYLSTRWHFRKSERSYDLGEIGSDNVKWIALTQDRNQWRALVNTVMNIRVP